jgi:hypothetical protein
MFGPFAFLPFPESEFLIPESVPSIAAQHHTALDASRASPRGPLQ